MNEEPSEKSRTTNDHLIQIVLDPQVEALVKRIDPGQIFESYQPTWFNGAKEVEHWMLDRCPMCRWSPEKMPGSPLEDDRDLWIDLKHGTWKCYGRCQKEGDMIDLVSELEGISRELAIALLFQRHSLSPGKRHVSP